MKQETPNIIYNQDVMTKNKLLHLLFCSLEFLGTNLEAGTIPLKPIVFVYFFQSFVGDLLVIYMLIHFDLR